MPTNYTKGTRAELAIHKKLEALGYQVFKMAMSRSPVDRIAVGVEKRDSEKEGRFLFIQCKSSIVEEVPNIQQLLNPIGFKKERYYVKGRQGCLSHKVQCDSNVKLLEDMIVPSNVTKLIIWKGKGKENYYTFQWLNNRWIMMKGFKV